MNHRSPLLLSLATVVVAACGDGTRGTGPPSLANVAGLWSLGIVESGSGVACVWDVALELTQTGRQVGGEQYSSTVTCSIAGSVSEERIPGDFVSGEVTGDQVVLVVTLTPDGDRDTLRGAVEGSEMGGASWGATRLFGPPPAGVISITQAKGKAGDTVTVEGTITVTQGALRLDDSYVQDLTGGIRLFGLESTLGLQAGDRVRVSGRVTAFHGEAELVGLATNTAPNVTVLGSAPLPDPELVGADLINSRLLEGELACIGAVRPVSVPNVAGAYTATFADDSLSENFQLRVEAGVATSLPPSFWQLDQAYSVTGILGSFDGVGQIKPRSLSDVSALVC